MAQSGRMAKVMQDSRRRANKKWLAANYEQIVFRAPKGTKEEIKAAATACGMSMAAFIQAACKEKAKTAVISSKIY